MFFLRALPKHLRVLVVEKGQVQDHADQLRRNIHVDEKIAIDNKSGAPKKWKAHTVFGGNSNCWWACTPRFMPSDFQLRRLYGVGEDWPIGYDDLADAYQEVEEVMEVAGGGSDHLLPRKKPFPFPPHVPSRSDVALQAHSPNWFAQPAARANGGSRAQCCANGICDLCPVDAKFSILNSLHHFRREGVSLVLGAELRAVDIDNGVARAVILRDETGREHRVSADLVALGTNAIFNAGILLRSGINGVTGHYLHEQVGMMATLDIGPGQGGYFGGTSITGHGYDLYDRPHRSRHGAVILELHNAPASVRAEPKRWTDRVQIKLIAEDLPQARNKVVLRDDDVVTEWHGHSPYALEALDWAQRKLLDIVPFDVEATAFSAPLVSEDHIQGTHRAGADPNTSVVDAELKCHSVRNLLALGAGAFPSGPPANPTLTLSAMSILAARAL